MDPGASQTSALPWSSPRVQLALPESRDCCELEEYLIGAEGFDFTMERELEKSSVSTRLEVGAQGPDT